MKGSTSAEPDGTACPPLDLRRFFDAFAPMLELKASAEDVERELGHSPSGTQRLGFYGVLARRNRFIALRQLCPSVRHAALALGPKVWEDLVTRYATTHPPDNPDPNRFAARLSDFIAAERAAGGAFPVYLEELADFEFTEWAVGVADFEPSADDPGLDRTIHVRHYSHDVPRFVTDLREGKSPHAPTAEPRAVIIYRDVATQWARSFFPTPLGLAALARRAGRPLAIPDAMLPAIEVAETELERHGILLTRARESCPHG